MNTSSKKNSLFFGWIIVYCGALVLGVTHGVVSNCFSLYIIPVSTALNVSREAFSVCAMIVNGIYAVISFASGRIYSRFGVAPTMKAAAIALPLGYFGYSLCPSLPLFYLCAVVIGISVSFLTFVPFTTIISNWFEDQRGKALGICFMGSGLGGMVMNSIAAILMDRFGWRVSLQLTALIMLLVLIPMIFFVIKVTPAEKGMKPLGLSDGRTALPEAYGPTAKEALPTLSFFLLVLVALIIGFASTVMGNVVNPHLCDLGFPTLYASTVVSVYLGALAAGKILLGILYDKLGAQKGTMISMAGFIIGMSGLLLGKNQWAHILILAAGLGTASSNVSYPVLTRFAFGTKDYTTIYGYLMGSNFVTCSLGVVIANAIYSATGSYNLVIVICIVLCAILAAIMPLVKPVRRPEKA